MFERIKAHIMSRHYSKQEEEEKWPGAICPKINKRVLKHVEKSNNCYFDGAGMVCLQCITWSAHLDYIVDLKAKTCTYSRWQQSGIPYLHVVSVAMKDGIDPHSIDMHKRAYAKIVYPCKYLYECCSCVRCLAL
jgi:hypothetical protein